MKYIFLDIDGTLFSEILRQVPQSAVLALKKTLENSQPEEFFKTLPDFDVIDRGNGFYECVPLGHSKATIIEMVLKKYGIAKEDAWVFGDSMNDLPMFRYAQNAVLMGKHDAGLEPYATFTTKTVEEDGIAYALEQLGLV